MSAIHPITGPRTVVALDYPDGAQAAALVERLDPGLCRLKVGKELFTRTGPGLVERFVGAGFDVFLDLKYHDIPNTVAGACDAASSLGVWMLNVHALGGRRMMEAAREAVDRYGAHKPLLIAVTVLTSMDEQDLAGVGLHGSPRDNVLRLARLAQASGMDGVVCSAQEAAELRTQLGPDFVLVTPGIRPGGAEVGDQRRVMSPADAVLAGSHYLVVGRPVTQAPDPLAVLHAIEEETNGLQ
jgi:orotidine-5'-phosphate decarboxylase